MRRRLDALRAGTGIILATVLVACGAGPTVATGGDGIDVLFVGNSLTFENDMPGILKALLDSAGLESRIESFAPGGWGLQDSSRPRAKRTGSSPAPQTDSPAPQA